MDTIDQLAAVLSLGATAAVAALTLGWSFWRLVRRGDEAAKCVQRFFRVTLVASLASGSVLLGLLVWLVGALELRSYHHHFAPFVWLLGFFANGALGAALGFLGALFLERISPPNNTPHTDARASSLLDRPRSARAGEHGR
jgi:hypothetical protein